MSTELLDWRDAFMKRIASPSFVEALFDRLPDIVFSIKDRSGRYVVMSEACVGRCGLTSKRDAIGRTAFDLFPAPMAERYTHQDEQLFRTGRPIVDNLDLTVYGDRSSGWCLSTKEPLRDSEGQVIGLACISKDLVEPSRAGLVDVSFVRAIDYLLEHFAEPLCAEDLARMAGLSPAQFGRRMKKIFHLTAAQYLIKTRVDAAAQRLVNSDQTIAEIALATGFCDQSSFSHRFRHTTGLTPGQYRQFVRDGRWI
ncbi:AraC family transcriptional regulator [Dokdonella soli]|uniref:AraC family transcriptional regulator n=2 Tax=Dokdonella soli TaxID=529810 RepID=A0ABN1IUL0_9GAMM